MRNLRASYWCGRRTLGASPANVWGRWWFRGSDVESDENERRVRGAGPVLGAGRPSCGEGGAMRKKSGVLRKRGLGFGFSRSREFGTVRRHSLAWCLVCRGKRTGPHQLRLKVAGGPAGVVRRRRLRPHCVRPTCGWAPVVRHQRADTDSVSPSC
jgi:hypothetical protein